ncbi:unnamed protein product [Rotaria sordida]|uniref:Replication protein A C-terminal domain-containing protein n=1 Tax=Rotaria sordida TaxID=392033 RepID=A0A819MFY2_9BILA|nr:unnamed protein product [Rotaria sordida]
MLSEDGLKELLEQTIRYQQFQKRVISSKSGAFTDRRVKDTQVRFQEAITQEKIIRILIEHVNNQQCSVQLSSQTTDNSTLPIDDVPDVSQIQSLSTPNPNSSEFVHASTSILNYLKTVPPTGASIADIYKQFNQFGEKQVQQAVEYLEQDGQIYSTNDRQRYFAAHI